MKPLMLEIIYGGTAWDAALEREVDAYIDESTGIQTIYQMQWLAERVHRDGANPDAPTDPWWYKDEYNRRLMLTVRQRVETVAADPARRETGALSRARQKSRHAVSRRPSSFRFHTVCSFAAVSAHKKLLSLFRIRGRLNVPTAA